MRFKKVTADGRTVCDAGVADSYFLRLRGLIGRDVETLGGLWIKPCGQIHTFFMSCPIDAVYLSKDMEVLKVDEAAQPGKMFPMVKRARSVLELPAGKAREYGIFPGVHMGLD